MTDNVELDHSGSIVYRLANDPETLLSAANLASIFHEFV